MSGGGVDRRARKPAPAREADVLDLGAAERGERRAASADTRAFYRDNAEEILARMRKPSAATSNPAAAIVAQCETDPRLRAEALCAIDDARRASDALATLQRTLDVYAPMHRPASAVSAGARSRAR